MPQFVIVEFVFKIFVGIFDTVCLNRMQYNKLLLTAQKQTNSSDIKWAKLCFSNLVKLCDII